MPKKIISLDELSRFKDKLDVVLEDKANVDGNYPTMHVGLADDLYYKGGQGSLQTKPFIFQATGTDSNTSTVQIGNFASFRSLRGNSVAFNQLAKLTKTTTTLRGITYTNNGDNTLSISGTSEQEENIVIGNFKLVQGHKYLAKTRFISGSPSSTTYYIKWATISYGADVGNGLLFTATSSNDNAYIVFYAYARNVSIDCKISLNVFDLTLMFGAGNEPTSVLEFNRLFPKPYYEYNAGTLLSCKANGIKNVGYNAWDEEWELGRLNTDKTSPDFGKNINSSTQIRCKDYIPVVQGETYTLEMPSGYNLFYFEYDKDYNPIFFNSNGYDYWSTPHEITVENNCCYLRFYMVASYGTTYKNDIAIHLTWDGSRTGYEEYHSETYPLPNIELKSAGSAYDEILPTGKLIRRIGSYTFTGNESFLDWQGSGVSLSIAITGLKASTNQNNVANVLWAKGKTVSYYQMFYQTSTVSEYDICVGTNQNILYIITTKTSNELKTALTGTTIYFELATPTEEEVAPYQQIQPIDDFGTQEFLYDSDIAIPIPQGYEAYYPANYTALVDQLYRHTDGDAYKLVLETELNAKVLNFMTAISGYDSTKTQTLKNVSGTLTWVDDE